MGAGPTISRQKIISATQGNQSLREVLEQVTATNSQTQKVTGTVPRGTVATSATAARRSPTASVPPQATGSISILGGAYVVQIVNPGGTSPISRLQAAQAAGNADSLTTLRPVTPIYHQIRASTSPAFNVNSNTQTFGGNTGSTQTYWTLTGLGTGTWYVQFRSSYDGVNFNTWKNANSGSTLGGLVNQVTTESAGNSDWALITLPGSMIVGVGAGIVDDASIFDLASQVYSSGMVAIAGPNGYAPNGNAVYGMTLCDVDLQIPTTGASGQSGIPDYPVEIRMQYGSSGYTSPGIANVFAIAFDPTNDAVTLYEQGGSTGAVWAVMRLPGGASVAFGQGRNAHGTSIWVPPTLGWISGTRMMSICSTTAAVNTGAVATGVSQSKLAGLVMNAQYLDPTGGSWNTTANWLAIAWQQGANVQTVGGHPFLEIELQGGHALTIGAGQSASAAAITLPSGYTGGNSLSIATPGGSDNSGHHLRGVQQCALYGTLPSLVYSDDSNTWSGAVNWMLAAWK